MEVMHWPLTPKNPVPLSQVFLLGPDTQCLDLPVSSAGCRGSLWTAHGQVYASQMETMAQS